MLQNHRLLHGGTATLHLHLYGVIAFLVGLRRLLERCLVLQLRRLRMLDDLLLRLLLCGWRIHLLRLLGVDTIGLL